MYIEGSRQEAVGRALDIADQYGIAFVSERRMETPNGEDWRQYIASGTHTPDTGTLLYRIHAAARTPISEAAEELGLKRP